MMIKLDSGDYVNTDYIDDFVSSNQIAKFLGVESLVQNRRMAQKIKYVMDNKDGWKYTNYPKRGYIRTLSYTN